MKKVLVIGGGTGTYVVLSGLRNYEVELSVVVSMMDSGGSTGRLRDQLGVLPPGDLRQCLVALSSAPDLWRKLFLYRFTSGDLKGHNFGNILLTALEKTTDDYSQVVKTASYILKTKGTVVPVTYDKVNLCVEYEDGEVIENESRIEEAFHKKSWIKKAFLKPTARPTKEAIELIGKSDFIIIGPGDLFTSLIPNLVVDGIKEAIVHSSGKIINIMNLMTKRGQTTNFQASDYLRELTKYLGRPVDRVILNNRPITQSVLDYYKRFGETQVIDDLPQNESALRHDLVSENIYTKSKSDTIMRSLLRHDTKKVTKVIWDIINSS